MCEYCSVDKKGESDCDTLLVVNEGLGVFATEDPEEKRLDLQVRYNGFPVDDNEWFSIPIKFCPMCGREL